MICHYFYHHRWLWSQRCLANFIILNHFFVNLLKIFLFVSLASTLMQILKIYFCGSYALYYLPEKKNESEINKLIFDIRPLDLSNMCLKYVCTITLTICLCFLSAKETCEKSSERNFSQDVIIGIKKYEIFHEEKNVTLFFLRSINFWEMCFMGVWTSRGELKKSASFCYLKIFEVLEGNWRTFGHY